MSTLRVLLVAAAVLLFVDLGASTIWDANEAFYVETPRQMVLTGDYVNPSFNGAPRWNKPVLSYWIVAGFYKTFGVSVTTERYAIALGALLLVGATFVIGRTVGGPNAGVLAALALASAPRVMFWSRRIFIDIWFPAFLALALMWFLLADAHPARRRGALVMMYVSLGLAMLTKGPAALVLPGLAIAVYWAWSGRLREIGHLMIPAGIVIIAAVVLPWYVMDFRQHGWEHIYNFFVGENLDRYADTVGVQNRSVLFYVPVLLTDLTPWALLFPAAVWLSWRERRDDTRLLMAWVAAFVGVFSLSHTKQDLYIFPAAPAMAALIGLLGARLIETPEAVAPNVNRLARGGALVSGLFVAVVGALVMRVTLVSPGVPGLRTAAIAGAIFLVGGVLAALAAPRARFATVAAALGATAVVANWVIVLFVMRPFEQFKPVAPMSDWLRTHAAPDAVVAHYKTPMPSMAYYLSRPYTTVLDLDSMAELTTREPGLFIVARPNDVREVQERTGATICVIADRPLPPFDAKLTELLAGRLPTLMLAGIGDSCKSR